MEVEVTDEEIFSATPRCNCCRKQVTRIIGPRTAWNESDNYLFHCKITGQITPIRDINWVIRTGKQEPPAE